jgi:hypothetical protein
MSLDVDLMVTQPCSIYSANITHNLTKMASEVKYGIEWVGEGELTLYDVLWRPDEHGFKYARDIANLLDIGWNILISKPDYFMTFNPDNGWGSYEGLEKFVYKYRNACWDNPDAELSVSR